MLALIGAGHTLQRFKSNFSEYEVFETHRDTLMAFEDKIEGDLSFLDQASAMVFSLTPSKAALNLVRNLSFDKKAILLSSIGVYSKKEPVVVEDGELASSDRAVLIHKIEQEFLKLPNSAVLRLGGLFDESRHPINSILSRGSNPEANELINFVHTDDVGIAIDILLKSDNQHQVYNLVDQNHPTKSEYYSKLAAAKGADPINFSHASDHQCQISSERFIKEFLTKKNFLNRVR